MPNGVYDLQAVVKAMKRGAVQFDRACKRDLDNLGYSDDELVRCIESLTPGHFHKTHEYDRGSFDAYTTIWPHVDSESNVHLDHLYIKLKLFEDDTGNAVLFASFHQPR